jgi:hypothetical protein
MNNSFKMVKKNNVWLMQGNQRIVKTEILHGHITLRVTQSHRYRPV